MDVNERRILYSNYLHRPKIFFFTSVAAGIQFMFLTYLSSKAVIKQTSNSSSFKWRVGLSAVSLLVSTLFAYTAMVYPLRTVNKMVFNIRRSTIELSTYTPFGKVHTKEVPVGDVMRLGSANTTSSAYLAIKVSNKSLFYLLDKRGKFNNSKMFDILISERI